MDEPGAPGWTQTWKVQEVKTQWLRTNILLLSDLVWTGLGKRKPIWSWVWQRMWRVTEKGFYKYINSKRKTGENMNPLLNGAWELVTQDSEKAKVLKSCVSLLVSNYCCQSTGITGHRNPRLILRWEGRIWSMYINTWWDRVKKNEAPVPKDFSSAHWQNKRPLAQSETCEIPSKHKETLFSVRLVKHWPRLPRNILECLSLEIPRDQLGVVLGLTCSTWPCVSRGVELNELRQTLSAYDILCFNLIYSVLLFWTIMLVYLPVISEDI